MNKPEGPFIEVAKIVKPQGIRGELKLLTYSRDPLDLPRYQMMYLISADGHYDDYRVEYVRLTNQTAIIKLAGIDDRTQAESLRDRILLVPEDQIPPPAAGEYFIKDLLGMQVMTQQGESLGTLTDVLELPAHDVYQVNNGPQELLIPAISSVILEIDPDRRCIIVNLPEGLQDLE